MDGLKTAHLRANVEYWMTDIIFEADKALKRVDKSRTLKVLSRVSSPLRMAIELVKAKGEVAKNVGELVDCSISEHDGFVLFDLYVSDLYFSTMDQVRLQYGRRAAKVMKVLGRQELIDNFEGEIKTLYTHRFSGEVLEGENLRITKDAI
jgi:hypothetical protein